MATFDYQDPNGKLLFQVVRFEPKGFAQRRPDGYGGWVWNIEGIEPVLYRLPELIRSEGTLFITEGEKQADILISIGFNATTSPMGAGKWRDEYSPSLQGRNVVILPDNDEAGRRHGEKVVASIMPFAASTKVVELDGLPDKGDVIDWLDQGHTADELRSIVDDAPTIW